MRHTYLAMSKVTRSSVKEPRAKGPTLEQKDALSTPPSPEITRLSKAMQPGTKSKRYLSLPQLSHWTTYQAMPELRLELAALRLKELSRAQNNLNIGYVCATEDGKADKEANSCGTQ